MRWKWISVAVAIWMLGMLSIAGFGSVGARSVDTAPVAQSDGALVVEPPTAWHDPLCAGNKQRYTLTFTNKGTMPLDNVVVTDVLPEVCPDGCEVCAWNGNDWPYDDCSPGATYDGGRAVTWELPRIGPGEQVTLYLEVRFRAYIPDGTVLENCLTVTSDQAGPVSACSDVLAQQCPTSTPTYTPSPTATWTPVPLTPIPTSGPSVTPSPTGSVTAMYKLYLPDIYAPHILVPPSPTPTPPITPTPQAPIVQCYHSEGGQGLIYRVDPSLFTGYAGPSASNYALEPITSPPAPAGWNQPGFVPGSGWRAPVEVWWPAWGTGDWAVTFPARIIGVNNSRGRPEGLDGTTHLIRQSFTLAPPEPGMHITDALLDMWSDNKTAWFWEGESVENDRQLSVGNHPLYPDHVSGTGGTYLLAIQNSNDYMRIENPQGTAYQICVTWSR